MNLRKSCYKFNAAGNTALLGVTLWAGSTWGAEPAGSVTATASPSVAVPAAAAAQSAAIALSAAEPAATTLATAGSAEPSSAPTPGTSAPVGATPVETTTCNEHLPEGKARPEFREAFPTRGTSGHTARLEVTLKHGSGEKLLPNGFELQADSPAAKALRAAGFMLPAANGTARVQVQSKTEANQVTSTLSIPVVPLPAKPGRAELTLPPLPVAMTRASGEVITLCTAPHTILVEDSIANQPNAMPRASSKPQRQRELWELMRNVAYGALVGLVVAALAAWLYSWWRKRPRVAPPPPPPRPAWDVALEALHDIRQSRLVEQGRLDVHLERVSHVLRRYLGDRYAFDGLESTSEEILDELRKLNLPREVFIDVRQFLSETDLVKFADVTPTESQCIWALEQAEGLVGRTRGLDGAAPNEGASTGPVEATSTTAQGGDQ